MKQLFKITYISIAMLLAQSCFAQYIPAKVEVSTEQANIKGTLFYLHKVEAKQTLYSIAKAYKTDIESIIADNPTLSSGLKEGSIIYIKVEKSQKEESGQTERALVTPPDTVVKFKAQHTVKWYESLSSIAKKYNVPEEEIAQANSLLNNKVETRQVLNIPFPGSYSSQEISAKTDSLDREAVKGVEKKKEDNLESIELFKNEKYDKLNVSLLIPMGSTSDSTVNRDLTQPNLFIDFYQGFLLSLNHLKEKNPGIKLKVNVVNTNDYSNSNQIIESGILDMSNLIIGPVFTENIEPILKYAQQRGVYVVSPMDLSSEHFAHEYSNFYQVSTPVSYLQKGILSAVNIFSHVTLIFEDRGSAPIELVELTQNVLESGRVRYKTLSYDILKGRSILPNIEEQLSTDKVNHVIVASNSEAFVSDVLRNLNLLKSQKDYNIVIYGTPQWRSFETVDIDYYHGMNLNISMQYFLDYNRANIKEFLLQFRALYNSEPSPYAFQAYDIANYFISNMWEHGKAFIYNTQNYKMEMLHSDYNFIRVDNNGGYINTAIRRVIYKPDYSTSDIRGFFR